MYLPDLKGKARMMQARWPRLLERGGKLGEFVRGNMSFVRKKAAGLEEVSDVCEALCKENDELKARIEKLESVIEGMAQVSVRSE